MKTEKYILALDQGTTSSRSILFNHSGEIVATAHKAFEQIYPKPGWVEHNPMEIWASQSATVTEALMRHNIDYNEIAAIGITNQRETTMVWDKQTGEPIYNAIVWQDRRTADICRQLQSDGIEPMLTEKTGLRLDPYFSATKLAWILDNVPSARKRAANGELLFGTIDSWLLWKLTGHKVHATDITNASRTLLMNLTTGDWDDSLLELFRIPRCLLPEIRSCSEVYGHVDSNLSYAEAPIAGIAGDQHAALFGQACFSEGMAKNTYGTGCFLLMNTGTHSVRSQHNLLTTVAWQIGDQTEYALEGSVFIGGAVVQWLRDELQLVRSAAELNELAASVPNSNGLFLVPAFAGLGAPHWDPYARGAMLGITRGTNRAHICRAALESIAFQSADLIHAMEQDSGIKLKELRVDGGASRSVPLLKFQSDLLQTRVVRPRNIESTAAGAAYLAGLAVGFWKDRKEIAAHWSAENQFDPKEDADAMQVLRDGWSKAVERSKAWEAAEDI